MAKKFVTIAQNKSKYRVFLDDIRAAYKKIRKNMPTIPAYQTEPGHLPSMHSDED